MAAINTISNPTNPRALYNQIVTALSAVTGVTDSLQLYALVAKLEIALSTLYIDKDGDNHMVFKDPNVALQKLQDLVGAVIPTTFLGYAGRARNTTPTLYSNRMYLLPVRPHAGAVATGLYAAAGASGGTTTVYSALYDAAGNKLAGASSPVTMGVNQAKYLPFASSYTMVAGNDYWAAVLNQNDNSHLRGRFLPWIGRQYNVGSFSLPATIPAPTSLTLSDVPNMLVTITGGII